MRKPQGILITLALAGLLYESTSHRSGNVALASASAAG
jgi:hypothetical protein